MAVRSADPMNRLEQAKALHRQGKLAEAEAIYRDLLRAEPDHAGALHFLAMVLYQTRRTECAAALLSRAIALNPGGADMHSNLGLMLAALQRPAEALIHYETALVLDPGHTGALFNRSLLLIVQHRFAEALAGLDRVIALQPNHPDAQFHRGVLLGGLGDSEAALAAFAQAIALRPDHALAQLHRGIMLLHLRRYAGALASFDAAIAVRPDDPEAHHNRGTALYELRRYDEALVSLTRALDLRPDYAAAYGNRGNVYRHLRQFGPALADLDRALALDPNNPVAHNNRGDVLRDLRRPDEALASLDQALASRPDFAVALNNRAAVLSDLQRYEAALADFDRAIAVDPAYAEAHANRGLVLHDLRHLDAALASFDRAIALKPDDANGYWNKSLTLLRQGRYREGWRLYEWRKALAAPVGNQFSQTQPWLGDGDIAGKTVLLHAEQGLGDSLQFCRYAPLVRARGPRVILSVPGPLVRLLRSMDPAIAVVDMDDEIPAFDLHCPLLSLPLAMATTLETIPAAVPYLHADPRQSAFWRDRLAALPGRKVGLVWAGSPRPHDPRANEVDRRRSVTLDHYAALATVPGLCLISLQKGEPVRTPPPGMVLHDWTGELHDFADTAALVSALDLVISVDTSVVHLAGALGRPVWVLNRFDQCWRWLSDRTDSPWYPTARLFGQRAPGQWQEVIGRVRDALAEHRR